MTLRRLLPLTQSTNVSHVGEEVGAVFVGNLAKSFVVEIPRVTRDAGDEHIGMEEAGILFQTVVVDQTGRGIHLRRQAKYR